MQPKKIPRPLLALLALGNFCVIASGSAREKVEILQCSPVPDPQRANYADAVVAHLAQRVGSTAPPFLLYGWAFQKRQLLPMASLKPNDLVEISLTPFAEKEKALGSTMVIDAIGRLELEQYWVESASLEKSLTPTSTQQALPFTIHTGPLIAGETWWKALPRLFQPPLVRMRSRLHSYDADCLFLPALNLYCKIVPKLYEDNYWQRDAQKKWDLPIATPLPALIDLHQQLATLRIPLYVVIAPETSTLYADYLTGIAAEGHWRANPETAQFAQALEKAGIPCLDLTPLFLRHRFYTYLGQRHTLYLPNDHHWSPYAARLAAQTTADWIRHREKTAPHRATAPPFTEKISVKTWKGNMRRFFPSEPDRVPAASIPFYSLNALTPKAATWRRPSPRAPAWDLLGNSFANIFRAQKSSFHHHLIAALEQPIRLTYSKGGGHTQCRLKWVRTRDISQSRGIIYLLTEKDLIAPRKWLRVSLEQPSKAASP